MTTEGSNGGIRDAPNGLRCPVDATADGSFNPAGLKVLVVDDDPMCLKVVSAMLQRCNYTVDTRTSGQEALKLLRERNEEGQQQFDLVLSDVYMPDMDGFKLLELIGLELDLPVIMMSSNGDTNVVLRGVTHGAVDFLIKPVRVEELRNLWQHVVRRRSMALNRTSATEEHSEHGCGTGVEDSLRGMMVPHHGVKRKESEGTLGDGGGGGAGGSSGGSNKKPRVVWSVEMHQQFVDAVNQLGVDKAVPKRILDIMKVEGLTRENVASHLQKYRLYLKRAQGLANGKPGRAVKGTMAEVAAANAMMAKASLGGGEDGTAAGDGTASGLPSTSAAAAAAGTPAAAAAGAAVPQMPPQAMMAAAVWQQQQLAMQAAAAAAAAAGGGVPGLMPPFMPPTPAALLAAAQFGGMPGFPPGMMQPGATPSTAALGSFYQPGGLPPTSAAMGPPAGAASAAGLPAAAAAGGGTPATGSVGPAAGSGSVGGTPLQGVAAASNASSEGGGGGNGRGSHTNSALTSSNAAAEAGTELPSTADLPSDGTQLKLELDSDALLHLDGTLDDTFLPDLEPTFQLPGLKQEDGGDEYLDYFLSAPADKL